MKHLLIIVCFISMLLSGPLGSDRFSIGLGNETMGIYGMLNLQYDLNDWGLDDFFITAGSFAIPVFGGCGVGTKYNFTSSRISPFMASSVLGVYALPVMCVKNCETKSDIVLSGSLGLDIRTYKEIYINLGAIGLYSFGDAPDESPSDIPELWPFINIRFGK